jgi:hypothetical protein
MNANGGTLTAEMLHGKNVVEMPVGQQDEPTFGLHAVEKILDQGQVVPRVNDAGVSRIFLFYHVAVGAEVTHRHASDLVFAHKKPLPFFIPA